MRRLAIGGLVWALLVLMGHGAPAAAGAELSEMVWPELSAMQADARAQLEAARRDFEDEIAEAGTDPVALAAAWSQLGQHFAAYSLWSPAAAALEHARLATPEDFRWHYLLAFIAERLGEVETAAAGFEATLVLHPSYLAAAVRLARVRLAQGAEEVAEEILSSVVVAADGNLAAAHAELAEIASRRGRPEEVIRHCELALSQQPEADRLYYPLGLALRDLGRVDEARAALARRGDQVARLHDPLVTQLATLASAASSQYLAGARARRQGDYDAAVLHLQQAVAAVPDSPRFHRGLGLALLDRGDAEAAVTAYRRAVELEPARSINHVDLAVALVRSGQPAAALPHFETAARITPGLRDAAQGVAVTLERLGRLEDSLEAYARWAELDATNQEPRWRRAMVLARLGRHETAEAELDAVLMAEPGHALARLNLGTLLARAGRAEEANSHLDAVARDRAAPPRLRARALTQLGLGVELGGDLRGAASRYQEALALADDLYVAQLRLSRALIVLGQAGAARSRLESALSEFPRSLELARCLALLLTASSEATARDRRWGTSLSETLFRSQPGSIHAQLVGQAAAQEGRFDLAVSWLERSRDLARGEGRSTTALEVVLAAYRRSQLVYDPWSRDPSLLALSVGEPAEAGPEGAP